MDLKGKKVVYVSEIHEHDDLSHENRLRLNAQEVELWLVDSKQKNSVLWGDDWNDAPDDCNSGTPYKDKCKGLVRIVVQLGKPLKERK